MRVVLVQEAAMIFPQFFVQVSHKVFERVLPALYRWYGVKEL